jgi:hypothetical protein
MSLALPAVNGLIVWTDRVGQVCAMAAELIAMRTAPALAPQSVRKDDIRSSLKDCALVDVLNDPNLARPAQGRIPDTAQAANSLRQNAPAGPT